MAEDKKEDLKEEEQTSTEPDQPEEKDESESSELEELKARLEKAEKDRDNYKEATLKYKKEEKTLEPNYPEWDDASKKFQKQTIEMTEKKAVEQAEKIVLDRLAKSNEKEAISRFIEKNPRYQDNKQWQGLLKRATFKSKESVSDIVEALQEADVLHRWKLGELDQKEKADVSDMATVSRKGSKSAAEGKALKDSEKRIAKLMGVDTKALEEEDMTQPAIEKF